MSLTEAILLLQAAIVSGYTSWRWYTEWLDRKEKKRQKEQGNAAKQEPDS